MQSLRVPSHRPTATAHSDSRTGLHWHSPRSRMAHGGGSQARGLNEALNREVKWDGEIVIKVEINVGGIGFGQKRPLAPQRAFNR